MNIKVGVVDILSKIERGNILFVYRGGLHHVQAPGDKLPKIFKTIKVNFEITDINEYKNNLYGYDKNSFCDNFVKNLKHRIEYKVP